MIKINEKEISAKLRNFYKYVFSSVTPILVKERLHTNFFSFLVFGLTLIFSFLMMADNPFKAGFVALFIASGDILGSLVAEDLKVKDTKHALMDSIIDIFSEVIFYTSAIVMLIQANDDLYATFAYLAMIGSLMTTFIIVRSKDFGYTYEWGFIKRPERFLLIALGLFFGRTGLGVMSFIVAAIANFSVGRLIWDIWLRKE